jgi:predicted metal-dependent phosphoesterase TrpH
LSSIFDLHVHTNEGSQDSALAPEEFIQEAHRLGINGAVFTEHDGWQGNRFLDYVNNREDDGIVLIHALEVYTTMGHIIVFGLKGYKPGMKDVPTLRKYVDEVGGFMIIAHPFRFFFPPHGIFTSNVLFEDPNQLPVTPEEAVQMHPIFKLVDEVEAVNGANDTAENAFAKEAARALGKPGTGGSDCHSKHGIARGCTVFDGDIRHERDLLDALRAGAYNPAYMIRGELNILS